MSWEEFAASQRTGIDVPLQDTYTLISNFIERGGPVLVVIAAVIMSMWTLILSRWLYLRFDHHGDIERFVRALSRWANDDSSHARLIRSQSLAAIGARLNAGLQLIRTLASLCPLLGLLGTVTGMIFVFEMMAVIGASSPRVVAAGVSTALVTTMAGMVGALSGIFPAALLARRARARMHVLRTGKGPALAAEPGPSHRRIGRLRYVAAPLGALVITLGLMVVMEQMILIGRAVLTDPVRGIPVDFVRIERSTTVEQRIPKPDRPEAPSEQPERVPQLTPADESSSGTLAVAAPRADVRLDGLVPRAQRGFAGVQDGEYLPIVKVAPVYPHRAELRKLEGWVLVRFTVTTSGAVHDIEVIESSDPIFEDAAVAAAEKFRYRPRVVDGEAIEVRGVINRITFVLQRPTV